jgi:hypothetical protein
MRKKLRNQVVSTLIWLWWVIDLPRFEFESETYWLFYLYLCSCGETCLLVSWCACGRCDMADIDKNCGMSRKPGVKNQRWSSTGRVLDGRTIGRSDDIVCGLYRAQGDDERMFFGWASKPRSTGFLIWASKPVALIWWFVTQTHRDGFLVWASKPSKLRFICCATKLMERGRRETRVEI